MTKEECRWVFKDAAISFIGKEFKALLHAGEKTNMFVCQLDGKGDPMCSCVHKGRWLYLRDTRSSVLDACFSVLDTCATVAQIRLFVKAIYPKSTGKYKKVNGKSRKKPTGESKNLNGDSKKVTGESKE